MLVGSGQDSLCGAVTTLSFQLHPGSERPLRPRLSAMDDTTALIKRPAASHVSLMPPPPIKRIKRPPKTLDEDDYTDGLSRIIARDYFPGLEESRAQSEYLAALDSGDQAWIAESSRRLRAAIDHKAPRPPRTTRDQRYDSRTAGATATIDTPRGYDGSQTPMSIVSEAVPGLEPAVDVSNHSISSFQSKYTSEDNASFNDVLDKQNQIRREKHAYMWTKDQRILSAGQIAYQAREQRLLTNQEQSDADAAKYGDMALIPLTTGAVAARSAKPDSWKVSRPDNTFMFFPDSISDTHPDATTIQEQKEQNSKAGPKELVYANTRFPPLYSLPSSDTPSGQIPPSPSLNTDILHQREADPSSGYDGASTPRVNGYAYVDEDEPELTPTTDERLPSYRDLLAGQTASPFRFSAQTKREALHHRLVEKTASAKRAKERNVVLDGTPISTVSTLKGMTPSTKKQNLAGNITPAAARLLAKIGNTPLRGSEKGSRMSNKEMWTPTPRKKGGG